MFYNDVYDVTDCNPVLSDDVCIDAETFIDMRADDVIMPTSREDAAARALIAMIREVSA